MAKQIAVRIPDELAESLEKLVDGGHYANTAEAVRAAVSELADRLRGQALDDAIREGYRRHPPNADEEAWVIAAGRDHVAEEPW